MDFGKENKIFYYNFLKNKLYHSINLVLEILFFYLYVLHYLNENLNEF